jgi:hypothetical protein
MLLLVLYKVGVTLSKISGVYWHEKRLTPCFIGKMSLSTEEPNAIRSFSLVVIM